MQLADISITSENGLRAQLAPAEQLRQAFANLGVSDAARIVLCSGTESVQMTTRVFFTLDYLGHRDHSLLDGGLAEWRSEGRPLSAETPVLTSAGCSDQSAIRALWSIPPGSTTTSATPPS